MLVLSRRADEKIILPTVPAMIKVISSQAGLVRLGIEAPATVPILREELCRQSQGLPGLSEPSGVPGRHVVRNNLNNVILGLTWLRMQLSDCDPAVRKTLDGLEAELQSLRRRIATCTDESESDAALVGP